MEAIVTTVNQWGAVSGRYLLGAVVQNLVFLALVFLALRLLRRAPARVLSWIATVGVLKLALPPLIPLAANGAAETAGGGPTAGLLFPFERIEAAGAGGQLGWTGGFTPVALLMMVWASVVLLRLGAGAWRTLELALAVRDAERIDDALLPHELAVRGLSVWKSDRVPLPLTFGVRPRRVFVPPSWDEWSPASRRSVLLHELAHVQRRDGVVQLLEILVQALYFFLPPVHWLVRRLHTVREMACDDCSVPADPRARLLYSRFLCSLAESMMDRPPTTASASTLARRKGELLDRVAYQVKEGAMKRIPKTRLAVALAVLILAVAPLSLVYGSEKPAPPAPPAKVAEVAPTESVAPPAPPAAPDKEKKEKKVSAPSDEQKKKEQLLKEKQGDAPPPPPKEAIHVVLGGENQKIVIDGSKVGDDERKPALEKAVQKHGGKCVVVLDGQGEVPMKMLHAVQSDLKELGLLKVVYAGSLDHKLPMMLPPEETRKKLAQLPPEQVVQVRVDAEGGVFLGEQKIKPQKLSAAVKKLLAEDPHRVFVLHTQPETRYAAFVQTLDALQQGGAEKIAVADPEA